MPAVQQGLLKFYSRNIWLCFVIPVWKHIINTEEPVFQHLQPEQVQETAEEFHCAFNIHQMKSLRMQQIITAALQSQYGGNDDINGAMWLLK